MSIDFQSIYFNNTVPTPQVGTSTKPFRPVLGPCPGNNYLIIERDTGRALTAFDHDLYVTSGNWSGTPHASVTWYCADNRGFLSFQNKANGKFLCHEGDGRMGFNTRMVITCDIFTPRPHPDGGLQIMVPEYWHSLRPMIVDPRTSRLVVPKEGQPADNAGIWEFFRVDNWIPAAPHFGSEAMMNALQMNGLHHS